MENTKTSFIDQCIYWSVGIWPDGADGTDVNSVDRSHGKQLVATGDDFGNVNLYRYPCVNKKVELVKVHFFGTQTSRYGFLFSSFRSLSGLSGKNIACIDHFHKWLPD